ncbi:GRAM domain-containing protein [Ancistrocladus abbreviatus]
MTTAVEMQDAMKEQRGVVIDAEASTSGSSIVKWKEETFDTPANSKCTRWSAHDKFGIVREVSFQHPIKVYFGAKHGCSRNFRVFGFTKTAIWLSRHHRKSAMYHMQIILQLRDSGIWRAFPINLEDLACCGLM